MLRSCGYSVHYSVHFELLIQINKGICHFTARRRDSAAYAMAVCLSVTSQCSIETAKCITQTMPRGSVADAKHVDEIQIGSPLTRERNTRWIGQMCEF